MPTISVVIPLFNKARSLPSTLATALRQTFADFEVLVIDDGSTDSGPEFVEQIADPRIRLIRQSNQGVSAARNRGIQAARGAWIAFLDADDLWRDHHLEELARSLGRHGVVANFSNFVYQSSGRAAVPPTVPSQIVNDYFTFALANGRYPMSSSSTLVRRDVLFDCGLFSVGVGIGEDVDMWCRLAFRGPFQYCDSITATYRDALSSGGVTGTPARAPQFPLFAQRLPDMIAAGYVPSPLERSASQYSNFLLLEYAKHLLDVGLLPEARSVLLRHCQPSWDPSTYVKRLFRTSVLGDRVYKIIDRGKRSAHRFWLGGRSE
jgi:glycosyltransferase involved in cell wall biosynthesis